MGTSFSSIHVYKDGFVTLPGFLFSSFSEGWQTCIEGLSGKDAAYCYKSAKLISQKESAPVLFFSLFDSDLIKLALFEGGTLSARYDDLAFTRAKNLSKLPASIGYEEGGKRRISRILACDSVDLKIELLEEYLGVCLLPFEEYFFEQREAELERRREDVKYKAFLKEERMLSGKDAPLSLEQEDQFIGKLFHHPFGSHKETFKEHCSLLGRRNEKERELTPVRFEGGSLCPIPAEEYTKDQTIDRYIDKAVREKYGEPFDTAIFTSEAPPSFAGKQMLLPRDSYPVAFLGDRYLIAEGNRRLYFINDSLQVVARRPIKGRFADIEGDHLLVASETSFFAFFYEETAKITIYKIKEHPSKTKE